VFLLYIYKFNTNLGRICFCFGGALGGVIMALEESSIWVSCLYKQTSFVPLLVGVRSSHPGHCGSYFGFRTDIGLY